MSALEPDREQLARFINILFRHAEEGGRVALRAFFDDEQAKKRNDPPFEKRTVRLNGVGLSGLTPGGWTETGGEMG